METRQTYDTDSTTATGGSGTTTGRSALDGCCDAAARFLCCTPDEAGTCCSTDDASASCGCLPAR